MAQRTHKDIDTRFFCFSEMMSVKPLNHGNTLSQALSFMLLDVSQLHYNLRFTNNSNFSPGVISSYFVSKPLAIFNIELISQTFEDTRPVYLIGYCTFGSSESELSVCVILSHVTVLGYRSQG
ncbi:hypothetical protein L9F63_024604, partial [Diploptera punctata]